MQPYLGQQIAASRMSDTLRSVERTKMIKEARAAKRRTTKQAPSSQRFTLAGTLRLGRAVRRLRAKPASTSTAAC